MINEAKRKATAFLKLKISVWQLLDLGLIYCVFETLGLVVDRHIHGRDVSAEIKAVNNFATTVTGLVVFALLFFFVDPKVSSSKS
tara:strand:+ start:857 stop:1111 length:255 start_codon:yes stop_codon:yes gene_type:complete